MYRAWLARITNLMWRLMTMSMVTKVCTVCKQEKAIDDMKRHSALKSGIASWCKECDRKKKRDYYDKQALKAAKAYDMAVAEGLAAQCSVCNERKAVSEFYKQKGTPTGHHSMCRLCFLKHSKDYRNDSREAILLREKLDRLKNKHKYVEYRNNHKDNDPASKKRQHLKSNYGMTVEQYNAMLDKQGHACAICKRPEDSIRNGRVKWLAVDHEHGSDPIKIRGLLCHSCNTALGHLKDNVALLEKAIDYLRRSQNV